MITRRQLLQGAASTALYGTSAGAAWAFGDASRVNIGELDLGAGTLSRPDAWERLLLEVRQATSVEVEPTPARIKPDTVDLFRHPLCVLLGDGEFAQPDARGLEQLARFLQYGGALYIDDTSGGGSVGFDRAVRRLAAALFPTTPLAPIPSDHSLYRSFFLLDRPYGRVATARYLEGVTLDGAEGRGGFTPLLYGRNDLSGALDRAPSGKERYACTPGGESQRREALKLGINLVLYCITTDYKKDQAHVKKLMEDHRLRGDWDIEAP